MHRMPSGGEEPACGRGGETKAANEPQGDASVRASEPGSSRTHVDDPNRVLGRIRAELRTRRPGMRRAAMALGSRVNAMSYLPKWVLLASLIGVIAGFGAVVFYEALQLATHLFLGVLAGYRVPTPAGEGDAAGSAGFSRPWAIPLVVTLGGLASGLLVFGFAPEAEGHGTDAAIDAVHHNPRGIRLRAVLVKIVASALTIGSGGSGGREGPTAQISAGFGSALSRVLDLSPEDGRIAVSVGIGSGIGAIFGAPLGGAVLSADVVYREDFEYAALLPGVFASILAYAIFGSFFGFRPLFAIPSGYQFDHPLQLAWFAIIGIVGGLIGLAYSKGFYGAVALSHRLPISRNLRPALGGAIVGLMALGLPEVLGTGYGWVQKGLSNDLLHTPLVIILLLPLARIAATALSIGTGGSGGVFGPGLVIGAFSGLAIWRILEPIAPGVGHDPVPFVVVGMMTVFGGISRAPLAVMIMVAEMVGNNSLLGPAMIAVAIASFIVGRSDDSIYRSQLARREDAPASRLALGLPLLGSTRVEDVRRAARLVLGDTTTIREAARLLHRAGVPGAPVVDERGTFIGTVTSSRIAELEGREPDASVEVALEPSAPAVASSATLDAGLAALVNAGGHWVTVTSGDRLVVGILSVGDLLRGYRSAVAGSVGRLAHLSTHAVALEERVGSSSPLVGQTVAGAGLPSGCVVVTVARHGERFVARGSTTFQRDDLVSVLVSDASLGAVREMVRGAGHGPDQHGPDQHGPDQHGPDQHGPDPG